MPAAARKTIWRQNRVCDTLVALVIADLSDRKERLEHGIDLTVLTLEQLLEFFMLSSMHRSLRWEVRETHATSSGELDDYEGHWIFRSQ